MGVGSGVYVFQFRNGSIKRLENARQSAPDHRFNSEMVRLKDAKTLSYSAAITGFNSEMVRLKEKRINQIRTVEIVSIPKWFD